MIFGFGKTPPTDVPSRAKNWYEDPKKREGTRLGRFLLKECLGQGGYAVTYRAIDTNSPVERLVVIKILYIRPNEDEREKARRFVVEGAALDLLANDPGFVVQVETGRRPARNPEEIDDAKAKDIRRKIDHGTDYYLVLQYMSGGNLWQRIEHKPLPPKLAMQIAMSVGQAISRAHRKKILHRDIKPDNILFDSEGNPKLADWGLALFMNKKGPRVGTGVANRPLGTPGYVSHESSLGRDTVQRDVYALGITLLEMSTGVLPNNASFDYQDWEPIIADRLGRIQSPELRAIVERAVAKKPRDRYRQVSEMTKAISDCLNQPSVGAPFAPPQPAPPSIWQRLEPILLSADKEGRELALKIWTAGRRILDGITIPPIPIPKPKVDPLPVLLQRYGQRAIIACGIWATLDLILTSWGEFYGQSLTFLLPLALGILSLLTPWAATLLAWGALCLLLFALSPVAGTIALMAAAISDYKLHHQSPAKREESLLFAWLILSTLPLVSLDLALAIPIAIGAHYKNLRHAIAAGGLTYLSLSFWASLQGASTLGPTVIFDPLGLGVAWYLDTTASTFFKPTELLTYLRLTASNWQEAWDFGALTYKQWTATLAPLLSLLIWASVSAVAALIARTPRWGSSAYQSRAVLLSILMFGSLTWLLVYLLNMQELLAKAHLLVAGLYSAIAATALIALLKLIKKRRV